MGAAGLWPRRARDSLDECERALLQQQSGIDARESDLLSRAVQVEGMTPEAFVDWCAQVEKVRCTPIKIREYLQDALQRVRVLACSPRSLKSWADVRAELAHPEKSSGDRSNRSRLLASVAYARDNTPALHMIWDAQSLGEA